MKAHEIPPQDRKCLNCMFCMMWDSTCALPERDFKSINYDDSPCPHFETEYLYTPPSPMPANLHTSTLLRYLRAELNQPYSTLELACITAIFYGSRTTRELSHHLNLTQESINRATAKLAKRRIITRTPAPSDEYSHYYTLTPAAKTFLRDFITSVKKPTNS